MNVHESVAAPARWNPGPTPKSFVPPRRSTKDRVEAALKSDQRVRAVKVTAVGGGVVRLSTKGASLQEQLRAIELAWGVAGVASEA